MRADCRSPLALACLTFAVLATPARAIAAGPPDRPLLVVLAETGESREGFPVLRLHPDPRANLDVLTHGFAATMVRLYAYEQAYLQRKEGRRPESAYLLRSSQQGGFARTGFWLGLEDKRTVGYVDLHRRSRLTGIFGAVDQIFPHELAHVIVSQLAGPPAGGCGSNQIHALGVRTDPVIAFHEGFAEHFQVLAVDDPDADPATKRLASDWYWVARSAGELAAYRRAMLARWPMGSRSRLAFPFWFGGTEQVLRYHAVKANSFARAPVVPPGLFDTTDPYAAYLLQSVLPGDPTGALKSASVALSTEGVVAALFTRWSANEGIRRRYREPTFYEAFGASVSTVSPLENVYLKLFHAWHVGKPRDTRSAIASYLVAFPDEAPLVEGVLREVLLGQPLRDAPPIWLANVAFRVGTSLYDQFRGQPRANTFDLNAATLVDLVSVPGVTRAQAEAILAAAPYPNLAALRAVPGITEAVVRQFDRMAREMDGRRAARRDDEEESLSIWAIVEPSIRRAALFVLIATIAAATLYRRIEPAGRVRAAINGFAAALLGLALGWALDSPFSVAAVVGPLLIFAVPATLIRLVRRRFFRASASATAPIGRLLLAWGCATLPALVLLQPLF
jgi:hypothetical protein